MLSISVQSRGIRRVAYANGNSRFILISYFHGGILQASDTF